MSVTFDDLPRLLGRTFTDPAGVMHRLMETRYDRATLWSALLLVSVLSALSLELTLVLAPGSGGMPAGTGAVTFALIVGAFLTMLVFAIYFIGHMLGGQGTFPHILLMMVWFQMVGVILQVVQIVVMLILPGLLGLVSLFGLVWMIFVWLNLIAAAHRFGSLLKALGTLVIAMFGVAFGLAILLTLIGVTAGVGTA